MSLEILELRTWSSDEISVVCLSVLLSVWQTYDLSQNENCARILIPHERTFNVVL